MSRHHLAACLAVTVLLGTRALADELTVTASVPWNLTPWMQTVQVQRFDPALGTLQSVRIELRTTIRGRVGYENLATTPAACQIAFQGTLDLFGPATFAMATIATSPVAIQTQGFDGTNDQAGSSGGSVTNLFAQATNLGQPNPNQVGAFVGAGTVGLQVSATNTSNLSSGSAVNFNARVTLEAQISVRYTYAPLAPVSVSSYGRPGSLLVFPEFNSNPGATSLISVTSCHGGSAPVRVRYVYVNSSNCTITDRNEDLTPNDTHTSLSSFHDPVPAQGYLYVYATNVVGEPIKHDFLMGSMVGFNGVTSYSYGMNALAFRAAPGLTLTDVDGDGIRDLNGVEYEKVADELLFPRFVGTTATRNADLILINLTGGAPFTAFVNLLIWNDDEMTFSAQTSFSCWAKRTLSSISSTFTNSFLHNTTAHDALEILGSPNDESGWFKLDGASSVSANVTLVDPAILAVLVERNGTGSFAVELPFYTGEQSNGDLMITSANGDTTGG